MFLGKCFQSVESLLHQAIVPLKSTAFGADGERFDLNLKAPALETPLEPFGAFVLDSAPFLWTGEI